MSAGSSAAMRIPSHCVRCTQLDGDVAMGANPALVGVFTAAVMRLNCVFDATLYGLRANATQQFQPEFRVFIALALPAITVIARHQYHPTSLECESAVHGVL